ncbi:antibiotic biosynthesis monooxygenase family protein [Spirosoma pulveris]
MYTRLVQVSLQPQALAEATDYFRTQVVPVLQEQAGFVNGSFLVSEQTHRCVMLTYWESAEARTGAETNGFLQSVLENMKPHFAGSPTIDYYEVPVQIN